MPLPPIEAGYTATRDALHRVATHVVARARHDATGRFGLRVTPGGFGTPEFGPGSERVRVSGGLLVRESGAPSAATSRAVAIDGSTLRDMAAFAGVDLATELSVGHDTPPVGDTQAAIPLHAPSALVLAAWYATVAAALDEIVARSPASATPTAAQLWPEHFDVALDLEAAPGRRANLGGSPGDGHHGDPYVYVGPWTPDRPGDASLWNAPFGALLAYDAVAAATEPVARIVEFFRQGLAALAS